MLNIYLIFVIEPHLKNLNFQNTEPWFLFCFLLSKINFLTLFKEAFSGSYFYLGRSTKIGFHNLIFKTRITAMR